MIKKKRNIGIIIGIGMIFLVILLNNKFNFLPFALAPPIRICEGDCSLPIECNPCYPNERAESCTVHPDQITVFNPKSSIYEYCSSFPPPTDITWNKQCTCIIDCIKNNNVNIDLGFQGSTLFTSSEMPKTITTSSTQQKEYQIVKRCQDIDSTWISGTELDRGLIDKSNSKIFSNIYETDVYVYIREYECEPEKVCSFIGQSCSKDSDCCDFELPEIACVNNKCAWEQTVEGKLCNNIIIDNKGGKIIDSSEWECLGEKVESKEILTGEACDIAKIQDPDINCDDIICCVGDSRFIGEIKLPKCDTCDEFAVSQLFGEFFKSRKCEPKTVLKVPIQNNAICFLSFIKLFLIPITFIFSILFGSKFLLRFDILKKNDILLWIINIILAGLLSYLVFLTFTIGIIIFIIYIIITIILGKIKN